MELSSRLQAVASLVTAGSRIVDIGTDHAYIPIYLMQEGLANAAIAMDVNRGPIKKAEEHVRENGMEGKIELRLSNGFEKLRALEADAAILAGMGGALMIRILKEYPKTTFSLRELILQPQSEIGKVRAFLLEEGFLFIREDMVKEDGKYYPMMKVAPPRYMKSKAEVWDETEIRYGKLLLEMKHTVLKEYLEREEAIRQKILWELRKQFGDRITKRKKELEEEMKYIQKGLGYYAM